MTKIPNGICCILPGTEARVSELYAFLVVVTCGNPADVPNSTSTKTGVNEGDTATYACESGFAVSGHSVNTTTATCGTNGNWDAVPTCVGKLYIAKCIVSYIMNK